ncbi:MAG: segregation/condensation protein A [Gammaproteobacteria bacterium]|nr:segregation/condensation protein A [Gammaproteobacteria bacterium]
MTETNTVENPPIEGGEEVSVDKVLAKVKGSLLTELPHDLYIPPEALEIFLEAFEGPLDLLLYLIKKQNLDILDIPIAEITRQYMEYVDLMKNLNIELAAEYLVMAAMLAEIKSRMLLPRPAVEDEEDDPRAELIRRLQEYERFKKAANDLNEMPIAGRDYYLTESLPFEKPVQNSQPQVSLDDVLKALRGVMSRAELFTHHHISREPLSVRERMSIVLNKVRKDSYTEFTSLFQVEEGRAGVIVALLAILELIKASLIELVQNEPYGTIHVKAAQ